MTEQIKLDQMSVTELLNMSGTDLRALYSTTEVVFKGEPIAVLMPYQTFARIKETISDVEVLIVRLERQGLVPPNSAVL